MTSSVTSSTTSSVTSSNMSSTNMSNSGTTNLNTSAISPSSSVVNVSSSSGSGAHYDIIVIGAGGVGSAAAYHCARAGKRVLLLEQYTVGHQRGSSHGGSRIIRYTHNKIEHAD